MFRRKDELDMDGETSDMQGSLLGEDSDNSVNVLSPQKAAEYQANKSSETEQGATGTTRSVSTASTASAGVAAASQGASFSSPSTFGQPATKSAEPVQQRPSTLTPPVTMPSQSTGPVNPVASNSNSNRPSHEGNRFRTTKEAPRTATPKTQAPSAPKSAPTSAPSSTFNHSESNLSLIHI